MDIQKSKEEFLQNGFCVIRDFLDLETVKELEKKIEKIFAKERKKRTSHSEEGIDFTLVRLFEVDELFQQMLLKKEVVDFTTEILGKDYHLIADGAIFNKPGQSISRWHCDDGVWLPLNEEVKRYPREMVMPVLQLGFMFFLTDVNDESEGPTQYVPGSHYSGREPDTQENIQFEGKKPVSILGKKGDVYCFNGQVWHRGAPNTSEKQRKIYQFCFSLRWVSQRLYPFVNYKLPKKIMDSNNEQLLRILGGSVP